jgi:hypothetical protein
MAQQAEPNTNVPGPGPTFQALPGMCPAQGLAQRLIGELAKLQVRFTEVMAIQGTCQ